MPMTRATRSRSASQASSAARLRSGRDLNLGDVITLNVGNIGLVVHDQQSGWWLMSVTQIDIDDDALERVMALSRAKTKKEAVNLALQFYAEKQERAASIARHFERARHWGALEDAERLHRAEKQTR